MTTAQTAYADILATKRILYLPSCVVVEMMAHLYSEIFAINKAGAMNKHVPEILQRLRTMRENLRATAEAYGKAHISLFIGDWKEDKLRARRLFFNIMSQLGFLAGMVGYEERNLLYDAIEGMTKEWVELDRVMDARATRKDCHTICRYFRNRKPDSWKQTMANIILTLDEEAEYREDDDHLILICFERMKILLLATIGDLERRKGTPGKFNPDRLIAVSDQEVQFSCPTCLELTDSLGAQAVGSDYPDSSYAAAILGLRGAACRMRPRSVRARASLMADDSNDASKSKRQSRMQWLREALGMDKGDKEMSLR